MRRVVAIVTAVSFAMAAPAFAQNAPVTDSQSSQTQATQPLLLDGQDAMAQFCDPAVDPNCRNGNGNTGLLVALGVAGAITGILIAIAASHRHSVSP